MPEPRDTWHPLVPLLIDHVLTRVEAKVNHFRRDVVKQVTRRLTLISIAVVIAVVSLTLLALCGKVVMDWCSAVWIVKLHAWWISTHKSIAKGYTQFRYVDASIDNRSRKRMLTSGECRCDFGEWLGDGKMGNITLSALKAFRFHSICFCVKYKYT